MGKARASLTLSFRDERGGGRSWGHRDTKRGQRVWPGQMGEVALGRKRDADQSRREMQEGGFCPETAGVSGKVERILFAINSAGERGAGGDIQVVRISNCGGGMARSCPARLREGPTEVRKGRSGGTAP